MSEHLVRLPSGMVINLDPDRIMMFTKFSADEADSAYLLNYFSAGNRGFAYAVSVRVEGGDAAAVKAHFAATTSALAPDGGESGPREFTSDDLGAAAKAVSAAALQEAANEIRDRNTGIGQLAPQLVGVIAMLESKAAEILGANIASSEGVEP